METYHHSKSAVDGVGNFNIEFVDLLYNFSDVIVLIAILST